MPTPKRAGRSAYVLVLREHDDQGSGYSLELAPLPASDARPRIGGRASTGVAAAAAAATTTGRGQTRELVAGGAPPCGLASTREMATTSTEVASGAPSRGLAATATGTAARARGASPVRQTATTGRSPPPRGTHARGLDTAVDMAAGASRGGEGEKRESDIEEVGDDAAEWDRILREMRALLYFQPPQDSVQFDDSSNLKIQKREVVIPVFLSPKKNNTKDEIWNKRQIMYGIALLGLLGFLPLIVSFLPQWALPTFAAFWGISSIGFPFGLYGTHKFEKGYSRHMGRLVFMGFCLFVIFLLYQYMARPVDIVWNIGFAIIGVVVMAGHLVSWVTGCMTGSDNDYESEFSREEEDTVTSDLLQRLLGFSDD